MSEVDRLRAFYPFDDDVLDQVENAAQGQENLSWEQYTRSLNIPQTKIFHPKDGKPIELIDIIPSDYDKTMVYHQPMGCILDSNILSHVVTLAAAQPESRVIAVGNPGQPGRGYGKLSIPDSTRVWQGDLKPTVAPLLEYLNTQRIFEAIHAGESYGADKTAASAEHAASYDHKVVAALMVEPVSVAKVGLIKMGLTFMSTSKHADKYLKPVRARSQAFLSAENNRDNPVLYPIGLARLSNLAIGHTLGQPGFEARVNRALFADDELHAGIAWGTASEFDRHNEREIIVKLLQAKHKGRVRALPLNGQTHAMNLDIFLNAALITQLSKNTI